MSRLESLRFDNLLYIAWRNLEGRRLRTFITVSGVVIGIGSIIFLLSFGIGLQRLVSNEVVGSRSLKLVDVVAATSTEPIDAETVSKVRGIENVQAVIPVATAGGRIDFNRASTDTVVYGVGPRYFEVSNYEEVLGSTAFSANNEIVINESVLRSTGLTREEVVGNTLSLTVTATPSGRDRAKLPASAESKVIGVVDTGAGFEVYAPEASFAALGLDSVGSLKVVVNDRDDIDGVKAAVESIGLVATSPADALAQIQALFRVFNYVLLGLGGIGMVVGVLGMFNTLTISLVERTKEIGLMVVLGSRAADIRRLFVTEALLLSTLGGVIGLLLAGTVGAVINAVLSEMARDGGNRAAIDLFYIPPWLALATIGFSALLGMIVVIFPARRAGRIDPIDVLRRD